MLYIVRSGVGANDHPQTTWYVDAPWPRHNAGGNPADVIEIQADGEELKLILDNVTGIPKCEGRRTVNWYGDDAKFIASYLEGVR